MILHPVHINALVVLGVGGNGPGAQQVNGTFVMTIGFTAIVARGTPQTIPTLVQIPTLGVLKLVGPSLTREQIGALYLCPIFGTKIHVYVILDRGDVVEAIVVTIQTRIDGGGCRLSTDVGESNLVRTTKEDPQQCDPRYNGGSSG